MDKLTKQQVYEWCADQKPVAFRVKKRGMIEVILDPDCFNDNNTVQLYQDEFLSLYE